NFPPAQPRLLQLLLTRLRKRGQPTELHHIRSGDVVMIKDPSCKTKLDPKWEGPYTVLLTSYFPVKFAERDKWIHHSHPPAAWPSGLSRDHKSRTSGNHSRFSSKRGLRWNQHG
uniref:Murine leukemia virus integrase C-terminal domain-containing protein n=1 Tax=Otus sunia TaxID=257818 RepID=A0A8C8AUM9_9STRI